MRDSRRDSLWRSRANRCRTETLLILLAASLASIALAQESQPPRRLDPAAWGDDHVGKPLPSYLTGDECLFCHRDIGATWGANRHQLTIRPASRDEPALVALRELNNGDEFADQTNYLLGSQRMTRYLRRSKDYGRLEVLSTSFAPETGSLLHGHEPRWQSETFGDRCAGCHATGVDSTARAFSALSLDCFTCHGDVPLEHTTDGSRVWLSSPNQEARQVISICGQCHLRGGRSKSSGLPYPNNFVAGDNLFRDFQVDFSDAAIAALPALDQHIYLNARDVVLFDNQATSCLTCHNVHQGSSVQHQQLTNTALCSACHVPGSENAVLREAWLPRMRRKAHHQVCDY